MNQTLEDIADVFSIFHDGTPENWNLKNERLTVSVSCLYLAELVSSDFEYFHIEISDTRNFKLVPWVLEGEEKLAISNLSEISKGDFEIISAKVNLDHIEICCHENLNIFNSPGGDFIFAANGIQIKAQDGGEISVDYLKSISESYWSKFRKSEQKN